MCFLFLQRAKAFDVSSKTRPHYAMNLRRSKSKWIAPVSCLTCHTHSLTFILFFLFFADSPSELRFHGSGAEWQHSLRLLLARGAPGHISGAGHGGHCQVHALELCLNGGLGGQLWRERGGRVHTEVKRGRWVAHALYVFSIISAISESNFRHFNQ